MKKLIIALALVCAITALAQIQNIFTGTRPNDGTGDNLYTAFNKVNANDTYIESQLAGIPIPSLTLLDNWSNYTGTALLAGFGGINTVSNRVNAVVLTNSWLANLLTYFNGANINDGTVNSNALDGLTLDWLQSLTVIPSGIVFSPGSGYSTGNAIDFDGYYGQASFLHGNVCFVNGGAPGLSGSFQTVFGSDGSALFGEGNVSIDDIGAVTFGETVYFNFGAYFTGGIELANLEVGSAFVVGDGEPLGIDAIDFDSSGGGASFLEGGVTITDDTAGNGGTTLMLQAQDNGTPMYLHVTSAGVATWTTSP